MNISSIIIKDNGSLTAYTKAALPFPEVVSSLSLGVTVTLCIIDTIHRTQINLSRMLLTIPGLLNMHNWSEVENIIDETLLRAYPTTTPTPYLAWDIAESGRRILVDTTFRTRNTKSLRVHSCSHQFGTEVHYGSKDMPVRDEYYMKWDLKELIVKKTDRFLDLDLANSIPIVNGSSHFPIMHNSEMYILDSTELFRSTSGKNKSIDLLDFSVFGGIDLIKFSDCSITNIDGDCTLKITLPQGKLFLNKTPIFSICGRLFFGYEFDTPTKNSLIINFRHIGGDMFRLADEAMRERFVFNTTTLKEDGIQKYVNEFVGSDLDGENFIGLIDHPNVFNNEIPYKSGMRIKGLKFPTNATGLLINQHTREVVNYTYGKYKHDKFMDRTEDGSYSRILKNNPDNLVYNCGFLKTNTHWYDEALAKDQPRFTLNDILAIVE